MTLEQLLVVQQHDSAIDRLAHQRASLPQIAAIAECDAETSHLGTQRDQVMTRRHALEREQKRLEDEVALIEDRRSSENDRLYSGTVTAHKDLQAIQAELEVLADRQAGLEDEVLDVMERTEPIDHELAEIDTAIAAVADRRAEIEAALAEARAGIDSESAAEAESRSLLAAEIADDLLAEYERVRVASGGIGVARLVDKTCEGCHLQLSAVDVDRLRKEPLDAMVYCTECRRLLVR